MTVKVKIAGTKGTVTVDPAEGATTREALIEAAREFGLPTPEEVVEQLAPVVDGKSSELDDQLPADATRVTAAPKVRNGS